MQKDKTIAAMKQLVSHVEVDPGAMRASRSRTRQSRTVVAPNDVSSSLMSTSSESDLAVIKSPSRPRSHAPSARTSEPKLPFTSPYAQGVSY